MNKLRIGIVLVVLFIMGIVMTVSGVSNLIKLNGTIPDFNYDSMQNIKKGDFVQGYICNIDGSYATTETTEKTYGITTDTYTSATYFLMPLINDTDWEDEMYITVVANNAEQWNMLYAINEATWEFYDGNTDVEFPEYGVVARVSKLGDEYEQYLVENMVEAEYWSSAAEVRQHIIPYCLTIYNTDSPYTSLAVGLVIIAVFAIAGVIFYIKVIKPQNAVETYQNTSEGAALQSGAAGNGFSESYVSPAPVPMPDLPQPQQADDFFAKSSKPVYSPAAEEPAAAAEVKSQTEAAPAPIAGDMDGLDTSVLDTEALEYYEETSEADIGDEFDFSNDGDYNIDSDSIEIS